MQKIDFFGGLHGNFLELVINVAINQIRYNISQPQFTPQGTCHLKNLDDHYDRIMRADHYSWRGLLFDHSDQVIRIVPTADDLLIGLTNSFLRAGNEQIELDSLEKDTIRKLSSSGKGLNFVRTISAEHGVHKDYPRSVVRNYFYSMLSLHEYGLGPMTEFDPGALHTHNFPFRALFDLRDFYTELNLAARFLDLNFYPTPELARLHQQFLAINPGYHSEQRCRRIWAAVLNCESYPVQLNLLEEAWINHQAAQCFRSYDLDLLSQDQYPSDTLEIATAIFDWKSQDH